MSTPNPCSRSSLMPLHVSTSLPLPMGCAYRATMGPKSIMVIRIGDR